MKQYRVVKAWPGVEVGKTSLVNSLGDFFIGGIHYPDFMISKMLKEGWIEEVVTRKTLENKMEDNLAWSQGLSGYLYIRSPKEIAEESKDHYLALLDEADKEWNKLSSEEMYKWTTCGKYGYHQFLRKYLESEGKI